MKVQTGQGKNKLSLIEPHIILWKMWSKEWRIWLSGAIPMKFVLWVHHRIRWIRNRTWDEKVMKKRSWEIKEVKKWKWWCWWIGKWKWKWRMCMFILKWQISTLILQVSLHLSPTIFSSNFVLNCNLVRKLITNWNLKL